MLLGKGPWLHGNTLKVRMSKKQPQDGPRSRLREEAKRRMKEAGQEMEANQEYWGLQEATSPSLKGQNRDTNSADTIAAVMTALTTTTTKTIKLYVGDIPAGTTDRNLFGLFSGYVHVLEANVAWVEGRKQSYGFVHVHISAELERARLEQLLEGDGPRLHDCLLSVKIANKQTPPRGWYSIGLEGQSKELEGQSKELEGQRKELEGKGQGGQWQRREGWTPGLNDLKEECAAFASASLVSIQSYCGLLEGLGGQGMGLEGQGMGIQGQRKPLEGQRKLPEGLRKGLEGQEKGLEGQRGLKGKEKGLKDQRKNPEGKMMAGRLLAAPVQPRLQTMKKELVKVEENMVVKVEKDMVVKF